MAQVPNASSLEVYLAQTLPLPSRVRALLHVPRVAFLVSKHVEGASHLIFSLLMTAQDVSAGPSTTLAESSCCHWA